VPLSSEIIKGTKILVVDDEEGIRKVLGLSLADSGYQVFTAENGEQALKVFRKTLPSIILTDIKMPGMDGIALLQKIKQENPDTEVIMITGHGDLDLAIKSLQSEAIDFVTKPINDDVLEIALNRAHEKISMREQLRAYTENLEALVKVQSAKLVEAERLLAIGQAIDGLSSAIKDITGDLDGGIRYFNQMPCFVSIHSRELKIVETNQLFSERLGHRVGGRSWEIYKAKENAPETCPVGMTFRTRKGQRAKETIKYLDGKELPVIIHTAPITNKDGELELVLEIAADISEVNRLQEELRSTQQRYQQLFDEVPCYISVQDREFKLAAANRRFKEDFGEDTDSYCYQIYKHRSQPCTDCPVARTFEDGQSHQAEMAVTSKSGEQINVLIWTAPIRNAAGEITQVMEMSTNITQIRRLQDNLTSLGFLISSISHGVKGLLTGLDGGMYLINSGVAKKDEAQIKEGWEVVEMMVDRIRNMVQNILFYAKERELQWEPVDVPGFAEDLCLTVENKIGQHGIEFTKNFENSPGRFEIDANLVRTAILNILENAIEAVLADKTKPKHRITFDVGHQDDHVIFDVRDDGTGMDKETRENMFTLFFSSKGHAGTGLGLYIANKIIRQHGGYIEVTSAPGQGSHFRVMLPRSLPQSAKQAMTKKDGQIVQCD
jgi:PAS domain S-box-containing protein